MPSSIPGAGARLGDFLIEKQIGMGGMGVVFKAIQEGLARPVALKILGRALSDPHQIARLQRESQAIARLNHPSIATVYSVGQDQDVCYMAMEYVDGESLFSVISGLKRSTQPRPTIDNLVNFVDPTEEVASCRFDIETAAFNGENEADNEPYDLPQCPDVVFQREHIRRSCEIVRDAARGLQHAHDKGVLHRDIKPGNVMVNKAGGVKVIDFGLARFLEDATVTRTGTLVGTPLYMSPEQVTGRITLDNRTDIYSLGVVLYELLTLRPAMLAESRELILQRIVNKSLPPISWQNASIPLPLENVVHKAISRDPDDRYLNAASFADDLQRFLEGNSVIAEPYRYAFDKREINASRPAWITTISMAFFLIGAMLTLSTGIALLFLLGGPSLDTDAVTSLVVPVVSQLFFISFLPIGYGLLAGRRWARTAAVTVCIILLTLVPMSLTSVLLTIPKTRRDYAEYLGVEVLLPALIMLAVVTASGVVLWKLTREDTRKWFLFAHSLRTEFRERRGRVTDVG